MTYYAALIHYSLISDESITVALNTDRKQRFVKPSFTVQSRKIRAKQGFKRAVEAHQVEESGQCALVSASSDRRLCALSTRRRGLEKNSSISTDGDLKPGRCRSVMVEPLTRRLTCFISIDIFNKMRNIQSQSVRDL